VRRRLMSLTLAIEHLSCAARAVQVAALDRISLTSSSVSLVMLLSLPRRRGGGFMRPYRIAWVLFSEDVTYSRVGPIAVDVVDLVPVRARPDERLRHEPVDVSRASEPSTVSLLAVQDDQRVAVLRNARLEQARLRQSAPAVVLPRPHAAERADVVKRKALNPAPFLAGHPVYFTRQSEAQHA